MLRDLAASLFNSIYNSFTFISQCALMGKILENEGLSIEFSHFTGFNGSVCYIVTVAI